MHAFNGVELIHLRAAQESAMQDTCVVLAYGETTDEWGNPEVFYTAGAAQACGFRPLSPREVQEAGLVPTIEARLRLAHDTPLDCRDRIRVTKRYGETLAVAEEYEIAGPVLLGPSGQVVYLSKVTT